MRRLREKLYNESGASILLAMLLFLVCCLVAASVLAAAGSNAGKIRSNRTEQQKYLLLSSAIQLVADEIQKAKYTWKYTVYEWEETVSSDTIDYFYCEQEVGTYSCNDLTTLLPLQESLEGELKKQFEAKSPSDGYQALSSNAVVEDSTEKTLSVVLPDDLAGYPYSVSGSPMAAYQIPKEVAVKVELDHTTHHIRLTAWLGNAVSAPADKSDTMIAELVAEEGTAPLLDYNNPEGRTPSSNTPAPSVSGSEIAKTMRWKLNWIKKGVS